jgi:hypothetical protein
MQALRGVLTTSVSCPFMMPSVHVGGLIGGGGGGLGLGLGGGEGLGGLGLATGGGGGEGNAWHTPAVQMRLVQSQVDTQRLPVPQAVAQPPPPQSCTAQHTWQVSTAQHSAACGR